ncbi:hypothetical protein KIH39_15740 [Telmatocola sphagniphila]|uniref:Uncharacterized protein n=1 Tax=Telmatocola sphagniphila TaxID=1123043 RepID=A0A8E6ES76_9BACT|nr:hypothetical protein [Telmatocola sphagniphila]QVL30304.1 hypothetical protein KIH39_15740 [Telmatocola sphagniphila]
MGDIHMPFNSYFLPEATFIVGAALVVVTFAIVLLRQMRKILIVVAFFIVLGWGFFLYPKYSNELPWKDIQHRFENLRLDSHGR